jgi:hypothetical protein
MGHACTHDHLPGPKRDEHPVVAVIAVIAIVVAMLLIAWVRLEVHGTSDIEAVLIEPVTETEPAAAPRLDQLRPDEEREVEAAVTSSRFATGFSP